MVIKIVNHKLQFTEKYPEIKQLFGYDTSLKWKVLLLVAIQFGMLAVVKDMSWKFVILLAYCFGGVINHALTLGKQRHNKPPKIWILILSSKLIY